MTYTSEPVEQSLPTSWLAASPASRIPSPADVADLLRTAVRSGGSFIDSYEKHAPPGSWARTYRVSSHRLEAETLRPSAVRSFNSGTVSASGFLTLNISESPSVVVESSLLGILEENPDPKYSLSPRACMGILRRAERRKRSLPQSLEAALVAVAEQTTTQPKPTT